MRRLKDKTKHSKQGAINHVDVDGFLLSYTFNPADLSVVGVYRNYIISMKYVSPFEYQDEIIEHARQLTKAMGDA